MVVRLKRQASSLNNSYFTNWDRNLLSLTHELSGPLTAARLNLDNYFLKQDAVSLSLLSANLKLMEDYLQTARQHIRQEPEVNRAFSVNRALSDIVNNLEPLADERQVQLIINNVEDCQLSGNPTRFKQIISCFVRNAIDAYDDCAHQYKRVTIEHYHKHGCLIISVQDHGSGIADEDKGNIFKPFYSTKRGSTGMGLGLSLAAESIKEDFGGKVKLASAKSVGTMFSLYFSLNQAR